MKIAIFTDCFLDLIGGIKTSIAAQKSELERRGHTVYLFSTGFPRSEKELKKLAREHIFLVPSCKVFFRGLTPVSRRPQVIEKWLMAHFPELDKFDIFYIHYEAGCSIAGINLAKQLGIPVVQVMHGREDMGETNIIPYGFRTSVAWFFNGLHSRHLPHSAKIPPDNYLADNSAKALMWELMVNHANTADLILSPSEHFRQKLLHYGVSTPIKILPNGFPDARFVDNIEKKSLRPGETLRIIWHSRISAEKRIMPFLNALTQVQGDFHLDIFGGGGDYYRARRFVKKHQLNASFYGNTDFSLINSFLQKAHLDVLVSYNFDTFGMTLIEAEATGTPVFFCDPDMKEIVPPGSFILSQDKTSEKMADALQELLDHPEKIAEMSEQMLAHRSEVLVSRKIDLLEKYFRELIS